MLPFPSTRRSPKTPSRARLRVEELEGRNLLAASGLGAVVGSFFQPREQTSDAAATESGSGEG